jgi:hypothetical protein
VGADLSSVKKWIGRLQSRTKRLGGVPEAKKFWFSRWRRQR